MVLANIHLVRKTIRTSFCSSQPYSRVRGAAVPPRTCGSARTH